MVSKPFVTPQRNKGLMVSKPLIRPAISGGGYVRGGRLTSHELILRCKTPRTYIGNCNTLHPKAISDQPKNIYFSGTFKKFPITPFEILRIDAKKSWALENVISGFKNGGETCWFWLSICEKIPGA